jgi:hypothetical protein
MAIEIISWWKLLLARVFIAPTLLPCLNQPTHTHGLREHGLQGTSRKGLARYFGSSPKAFVVFST